MKKPLVKNSFRNFAQFAKLLPSCTKICSFTAFDFVERERERDRGKCMHCPSCSISHKISKSDSSGGEPVICEPYVHSLISGAMSAPPDNQSPGNKWHFTWGTTLLHSCSAVKNLYVKRNILIGEIFVLVKISYSSVRELSCGLNVRTARTV